MKVAASPRIYMRKFETGGFLVSQTQSLATNPQLLISSHQSLTPLIRSFAFARASLTWRRVSSTERLLSMMTSA